MGAICPVIYFEEDTATQRPVYRSVVTPDDLASVNGTVYASPLGSGADDAPRLAQLTSGLAYSGVLSLRPGTFQIKTPWLMPSGTTIVCSRGTIINSTLPYGFSVQQCPFFVGTVPVGGAHLPIVGSNTPGTTSVTVTGAVLAGQVVSLTNANGFFGSTYNVVASTPSGGNSILTVERPIAYQFRASNSDYAIVATPTTLCPTGRMEDTRIYGNGALIQGSGYAGFELFGAYRCFVKDFVQTGNYCAAVVLDNALFSGVKGMTATFGATPGAGVSYGYFIEGETCFADKCTAIGFSDGNAFGHGLQSAVNSWLLNCSSYGCNLGAQVSSEGADASLDKYNVGYGSGIRGGAFVGGGVGVQVQRGCVDTKIIGTVSKYNATGYKLVGAQGPAPSTARTHLIGVDGSDNSGYALTQDSDVTGTVVRGMTASRNGSAIQWNGYIDVSGLVVGDTTGNSGPVIQYGTNAAGALDGFEIHTNTTSTVALQAIGATIDVRATRGKIFLEGASNVGLLQTTASVVAIDNVDVVQTGTSGTGISSTGTSVTRIGSNVDVDGCTTPLSVSGQSSRGTVVANGATGVDVLFADLRSTDRVHLTLKTVGGTPGRPPTVAYVTSTKFTVTSIAGDTSTYEYVVI